jgi:hypothetical protein
VRFAAQFLLDVDQFRLLIEPVDRDDALMRVVDQRSVIRLLRDQVGGDINYINSQGRVGISAQSSARFGAQNQPARFGLRFAPRFQEIR